VSGIKVVIKDEHGLFRENHTFEFSLPFANGVMTQSHALLFNEDDGVQKNVHFQPLTYWPNGSIKWARCWLDCTLKAGEQKTLHLTLIENKVNQQALHSEKPDPLPTLKFIDSVGSQHVITFCKVPTLRSPLSSTFEGYNDKFPHLSFQLTVKTFANGKVSRHQVRICNRNRAIHPNGQWDIGDENSIQFKALTAHFPLEDSQYLHWTDRNEHNDDWHESAAGFQVIQHSSGGENWNCTTHLDRNAQVPFNIKGYEIRSGNQSISGDRILPEVHVKNASRTLTVRLDKFWQNFPSSMSVDDGGIEIGLFPKLDYLHELLPGERKTQTIWCSRDVDRDLLEKYASPTSIVIDPSYLESCLCIPHFSHKSEPDLTRITDLSLDEKKGFKAKRELIDEYGWRNFGDLYADHENAEYSGEGLIVSHYNNQYDPVYGFLRQYMRTGQSEWFELADDLAKHVVDIDIYHTELDRPEYNGGLFWHTDHYVDAATAGHRTYSKSQPQDVYMDHAGGGGPGGQHCYTTGLAFHYALTGDVASKQAVLKLSDWISTVYEGSGSIFEYLQSVKSEQVLDSRNKKTGEYPLDRGTANYIVALIDSFELTNKQSYLDKAGLVIKYTVKLDDNLSARNLEDVENTWFYTVFIQAVCRFMNAKEVIKQRDESYKYAIQVLLKFADWMAKHERPYLTKPEILEFPNETWTAQDLRKANILFIAATYVDENQHYLAKANEIRHYVIKELSQYDNSDYCRILCLLLQNEGVMNFTQDKEKSRVDDLSFNSLHENNNEFNYLKTVLSDFSLRQELTWLSYRIPAVSKVLNLMGPAK